MTMAITQKIRETKIPITHVLNTHETQTHAAGCNLGSKMTAKNLLQMLSLTAVTAIQLAA